MSYRWMSRLRAGGTALAAIVIAACGGTNGSSTGGGSDSGSTTYSVGGTVSGLSGTGLTLISNTGETLTVATNGSFHLATPFASGNPYYVLVLTQPSSPTQTCHASNAAGTVGSANVTGISILCQTKTVSSDSIGGAVVGLTGSGLVLQNNGGDNLAVTANGAFSFPTRLPSGSRYSVSVLSPPINPNEDCVVLNGSGTTSDSDVANIAIACQVNINPTHSIGGTVSGVSGTLVLQDNGRDDLTLTADGAFKFALPVPSGSNYDVTVKSAAGAQSQTCTLTNATGTVGSGDVSNVSITCKANTGLIASVSGLNGSGLVLRNSVNGDQLAVSANGTSSFSVALPAGGAYAVSVVSQPTNLSQNCVVPNGTGTTSSGTATVTVTCTTNSYTVGGIVTGLPDPNQNANLNLVLQNNLGDDITISPTVGSPHSFTFQTPILSGGSYSVTIKSQPGIDTTFGTAGVVQTSTVCVVMNYSNTGSVTNANITSVVINCVRPAGFAYVANNGSASVSTYVIDSATGALLPTGRPVTTGSGPSALMDYGNAELFVANLGSSNVADYSIDPNTGTLTPFASSPFPAGVTAPTSIALQFPVDGETLYLTGRDAGGQGSISGILHPGIGATPSTLTGSPFPAGLAPVSGLFVNAGNPYFNTYYLEADLGAATVSLHTYDVELGTLGAPTPYHTGNAPRSVATVQTTNPANAFAATHVYVANSADNTISIYSLDTPNGTLTALPSSPVAAPSGLNALASISSSNCGCYVLASSSQGVSVFSTDLTGALTPVSGAPYPAGGGPGAISLLQGVIGANAQNAVYVINTLDNTVSAFTQDPATGALTAVPGPAVLTGGSAPLAIRVMPRPAFGGL